MKIKIGALVVSAIIAFTTAAEAQKSATLRNQDVIDMKEAGLSDDLILVKIQSSTTVFATNAADLVALKSKGISDAVIAAMMKPAKVAASSGKESGVSSSSQLQSSVIPHKSVAGAILLSLVIPGGGQFYNGQYAKGAVMLAGTVGGFALAATHIPTSDSSCYYTAFGGLNCYAQDNSSKGLFYGGLAAAGGISIWSIFDAALGAERINHSTAYTHLRRLQVLPNNKGVQVAYKYSFN